MKKNKLLIASIILLQFSYTYSQANYCEDLISMAIGHLEGNEYSEPNYEYAFGLLNVCSNRDEPNALNLLGLMYLRGQHVQVDENKAFELIERAANQGYNPAEYNLGRFYKLGTGCNIDFEKAIYWFEKAANHGNEQAAYSLGYMHLKGFGVEQSYDKAIDWFEITEWPMAKHWLGYCYYLGYGVEQNTEKALELLYSNKIINSQNLYRSLESDPKKKVKQKIEKELLAFKKNNANSIEEYIEGVKNTKKVKKIEAKNLTGIWKGNLIEFDWSGKQIERMLPISLELNNTENGVDYIWDANNKKSEDFAISIDNALYFENLRLTLDMPYSDDSFTKEMEWRILALNLRFKKINEKTYLIGKLETYSDKFKEPGPPMSLILTSTNVFVNSESKDDFNEKEADEELIKEDIDISEKALLSLVAQEDQFIKLYPNPFVNDLLIQYELDRSRQVSIEIYSYAGTDRKIVLNNVKQQEGSHTFNIDGSNLSSGLYIISVNTDNEKFSRIIIKD